MTNTTTDWPAVLAGVADEQELRLALLQLSDEDCFREPEREWLREAACREFVLKPAGERGGRYYWTYGYKSPASREINGTTAEWLMMRCGEVDCSDNPRKRGGFTVYRPSAQEAWADLLAALTMSPLKEGDVDWELLHEPEDDLEPEDSFQFDEDVAFVRRQMRAGNDWAWCQVEVRGTYKTLTQSAYLGGCSYASEEDFKVGGYFQDMRAEVVAELNKRLNLPEA